VNDIEGRPVDYALISIGSGFAGLLAVIATVALTQSLMQGSVMGAANTPLAPMLPFLWPTFATALVSLLALRGSLVVNWHSRLVEILLPALILGSFAGISALDSWGTQFSSLTDEALRGTPDEQVTGMSLFIGGSILMGVTAGLTLGAFLPYYHRQSFVKPRHPAGISQLREFREAAERKFGMEKGWLWMLSPLPELGYIAPAEAINFRAKFMKVAQMVQFDHAADRNLSLSSGIGRMSRRMTRSPRWLLDRNPGRRLSADQLVHSQACEAKRTPANRMTCGRVEQGGFTSGRR